LEVADIFRDYGAAWRSANAGHVSLDQLKVMSAIERCRTVALGGHVARCEDCAHTVIAYNSCRDRHCPKCQAAAAKEWLAERQADLAEARAQPARQGARLQDAGPVPRVRSEGTNRRFDQVAPGDLLNPKHPCRGPERGYPTGRSSLGVNSSLATDAGTVTGGPSSIRSTRMKLVNQGSHLWNIATKSAGNPRRLFNPGTGVPARRMYDKIGYLQPGFSHSLLGMKPCHEHNPRFVRWRHDALGFSVFTGAR
jgi:hypothetical protein